MTTVTTQRIKYEGFTAYILGYAKTDEGFVYLRMVGPHNAVKAIWATLVGAQKTQKEKWQRIQRALRLSVILMGGTSPVHP